jgi:glycolate oxidase iron-sulfur subunit
MAETLGRLATDLGERSLYDAAAQCSRCGYCEQSCPTYKATGDEKKSPRGRNQLVRLLIEKKLPDPGAAAEALETCLLCSACTSACYARVPTADIVLEGRRLLAERRPWPGRALSRLLLDHRPLFELLLKGANLAKRLGVSRLGRPFLRLMGLPGLAVADEHVSLAPLQFSHERLRSGAKPGAPLQFMPCGTRYLFTDVAAATQKALGTTPLDAGCCGLLAYNYGELSDAREFARRVIAASAASAAETPIVVDCSSCAAFLKSYPQLFLNEPEWKARAQSFAARVKDAAELLPLPKSVPDATYHESCRACHGQGLKAPEGFRPLKDAKDCCGGAGAFSFLNPELSDEILRKKIANIAATGATVVATSSTSCLIQLAHGLEKYYPACVVKHVSEIAAFPDGEARISGTP